MLSEISEKAFASADFTLRKKPRLNFLRIQAADLRGRCPAALRLETVVRGVLRSSFRCALEHMRRGDAGTQATGGEIVRMGSHHALEQLRACHAEGGIMRTRGHAGGARRG